MQCRERNLSLDLYRVLCMFLITFLHAVGYTNAQGELDYNHYNFYLVTVLSVLQRISITGFTLISAYFLIDSTSTMKKILSFWIQLVVYSLIIWLCTCAVRPEAFTFKLAIKSAFPVLTYHYWYPVSYLILLLFAPVLNKMIRALSQRELLAVVGLLGFFVSVFFQLNPCTEAQMIVGHPSHGLIWFILLYCIAGYLKLYGLRRPVLAAGVVFAFSGVLLVMLYVAASVAYTHPEGVHPLILTFFRKVDLMSYNSVLPLLLSVSSFVLFLHWKLPAGKWMSRAGAFLAPTVFGVYLIQEHNAVREALWRFVNLNRWARTPWLVPMIVVVFLGLWLGSMVVYLLYRLAHKLFLGRLEEALLPLKWRRKPQATEK